MIDMKGLRKKRCCLLLLIFVFLLAGCGSQKALTDKAFFSKMKENGFKVEEDTKGAAEYNEVKTIILASNSEYQIEYYAFEKEEYAINFFNSNKEVIEESFAGGNAHITSSAVYNQNFSVTTSTDYVYLARMKDTSILVLADKEDKNSVEAIMKKLGY